MKIKYKLSEIHPRVFLVEVDDSYDLNMLFCRAQEFYESPYKSIRNKKFTLLEFIALYSKHRGDGNFTYPTDWAGFNVPGNVLDTLYNGKNIVDFNVYDKTLKDIIDICSPESGKYYIIGSDTDNDETIDHELAHALFYLNKQYKKDTTKIVKSLPDKIYKKICNGLFDHGYIKSVIVDEVQAYLVHDISQISEMSCLTEKQENTLEKYHLKIRECFSLALSAQ